MTTYAELAMKYQTVPAVATEMVNLNAILSLPKPTEAFMSDIHGEYDAFQHVLRNGSGNVKAKIRDCFHDEMTEQTLQEFAFWFTILQNALRPSNNSYKAMRCSNGI